MSEPLVPASSDFIVVHLRKIAAERLDWSPEQIASIHPDTVLATDLPLDSLAQVVVASSIEEEFGLTIDIEDWQQIQTVNDLSELIAARRATELKQ